MTNEEAKVQKKLNSQERVRKPGLLEWRHCWAVVKKQSTGSAHNRIFGRFGNCERNARRGCLTCSGHKDHEEEARELEQQLKEREGKRDLAMLADVKTLTKK